MPVINTAYKGDMLFESQCGTHSLITDVPPSMGGKDRGPMPPQLFIASLGTCVAVLITDFCRHHDLDPEGMDVSVSYDFAEHPARMTNIAVRINLPNVICDDECTSKALESVAEHCPVHETIATLKDVKFDIVTGG